jgi:bla regulator protein blaR1
MMPIAWDAWSSWLAGRLLAGSLQGMVGVGVVWLVCRRFPTIPASLRALAWWIVSLGLLLSLSSLPSLPLPLLPAPARLAPVDSVEIRPVRLPLPANEAPSPQPRAQFVDRRGSEAVARSSPGWVSVAIALWMAGALVHAFRLLMAYTSLRRAVRRSAPLPEDDVAQANRAAAALGFTQTPRIRLSDEIPAPLVTGVVRPVVLIPPSAIAGLSPCERAMVIGHELAHIRRRDLLFAWVPAIAERLFFFHPLARLAAREYAAERESACDALVLGAMNVAPHDYGRMLVRLGIAGANPAFTVGGSSPSSSSLRRRLDMLHDATSARSSRASILLVAVVATLVVLPLRIVARTPASPQGAAAPAVPAAPSRPVAPAPAQKPQPAAPAASRPVARRNAPDGASFEQAIAEQRRHLLELEEALSKMSAELRALYAQEREAQTTREQRQAEATRRVFEEALAARDRVESPRRATTTQFLEDELRVLTAEHEQTNLRLRQLSAEIDSLRQKLDDARRAQEIESIQKKSDEKK